MPEETSTAAARAPESASQARQQTSRNEKPANATKRRSPRKNSSDAGGEEKVNAIQAVVASSRFIVIAEVQGDVEVHSYWS